MINHSENFVHPIDDKIHTQNIERLWRDLKENIKRPGKNCKYLEQYLHHYFFIKSFDSSQNLLHNFLIEAGRLYVPGNRSATEDSSSSA